MGPSKTIKKQTRLADKGSINYAGMHFKESDSRKDEDRLLGSNNLVKYILANNKMVIQQQRAKQQELETARVASLAETTKENEIEGDDNMERPTNRQRLM